MATKTGRKSKLPAITDNMDLIKKWKRAGATNDQIADKLGMARSTFQKYLADNKKIADQLSACTMDLVSELRGELARIALPHEQTTKKVYKKRDEDGNEWSYSEMTTKQVDGSVGAIHLLLKNLDRKNWKNDWDTFDFKKKELELKKELAELKGFY